MLAYLKQARPGWTVSITEPQWCRFGYAIKIGVIARIDVPYPPSRFSMEHLGLDTTSESALYNAVLHVAGLRP